MSGVLFGMVPVDAVDSVGTMKSSEDELHLQINVQGNISDATGTLTTVLDEVT